mmetsp:Transcript_11908/g.15183  ORF Transcript_11908/g.15183 Transcript_11908/m.15183 type:complete len:191 (-) Transcript_11908:1201-1773(-)
MEYSEPSSSPLQETTVIYEMQSAQTEEQSMTPRSFLTSKSLGKRDEGAECDINKSKSSFTTVMTSSQDISLREPAAWPTQGEDGGEPSKLRRVAFQFGIFLLTYVNYGVLHATRSSWSMATKDLKDLYGWSDGLASDMNATFLFTYSLGGFFLSHLGDIYSKRKLICFMYTLIAITELCLGFLQYVDVSD